MLRIDVDVDGDAPYEIPSGNPYADSTLCGNAGRNPDGSNCAEIFLSGVRNPWRWSFDRANGDLYIGDVGQGAREEVDVIPAGQQSGVINLGWNAMEGLICGPGDSTCNPSDFTLPVWDYPRDLGQSVTGGYVYRGSCYPDIQGWYFFGDFETRRIWTFVYTGAAVVTPDEATGIDPDGQINGLSSFGEDAFGELYVVSMNTGEVFHITAGP
jgi:hypothetical protein